MSLGVRKRELSNTLGMVCSIVVLFDFCLLWGCMLWIDVYLLLGGIVWRISPMQKSRL